MTCRDKLKIEHPEFIVANQPGGCYGCPNLFGYLKKPPYCSKRTIYGPILCKICWDREIPENGSDKK